MPVTFERASALFDRVTSGDVAAEPHALLEAAGGDHELATAVRAMLNAETSDLLTTPIFGDSFPPSELPPECTGAGATEDATPRSIGPYEIEGVLGTGATGVVYAARGPAPLRRPFAIKMLHAAAGTSAAARFRREQDILNGLAHPGIAAVHDIGESADGRLYTVVEMVPGAWITRYHAAAGGGWRTAAELVAAAAEAVDYAHRRGVIHRDLKPSNLLVTTAAGGPQVKVIDFGIAKPTVSSDTLRTEQGNLIGTLAYMSPEQLGDPSGVDVTTDVYALGVVLHELVEGTHPFGGGRASLPELITRVGRGVLPPLRACPQPTRRELEAVLRRATEPHPTDRYPSAREFRDDLVRLLSGEPVAARPLSRRERVWRRVRRRPYTAAAAAIAGLALLATGAGFAAAGADAARQRDTLSRLSLRLAEDVLQKLADLSGTDRVRADLVRVLDDNADRLLKADPDDPDAILQRLLVDEAIADLDAVRDRWAEALPARLSALRHAERLTAHRAADFHLVEHHIRVLVKYGDTLQRLDRAEEQIDAYQRAERLLIDRGRPVLDPDDFTSRLCFSLERRAYFHWRNGDGERARRIGAERTALAEALLEKHPDDPAAHYNLGWALIHHLFFADEAMPIAERAELAERAAHHADIAAEREPHRWMYRQLQVNTHKNVALFFAALGNEEEARRRMRQAAELAALVSAQNPADVDMRRYADGLAEIAARMQAEP